MNLLAGHWVGGTCWQIPISTGARDSWLWQSSSDWNYYFGDTDPRHYGVQGKAYVIDAVGSRTGLPSLSSVTTRYLAVSASLQWGPWGPPGFFSALDSVSPVRMTQDTTIAIYRTHDLCARQSIGLSQNPHQ
jgi:hypothetical protein